MTPHIDLRRMRYVLEVARAQGITSGAEVLGMTQSAISRSIAEVEEALGVQLFHRLARGTELTPAGERFVSGAKQILADAENLWMQVRETNGRISGRLRVGVAPRGFISHASRTMKAFARAHPAVGVEITTGSAQALCPRLLNGELDLVIGSNSYLRRWADLELEPLVKLQFGILVRAGHPLTELRELREIDVFSYPFIMAETVEPVYSDIGQRVAHHGLAPFQPLYVVDDDRTVCRLLLASDSVYPLHSQDFSAVDERLVVLPDAICLPPHFVTLAHTPARQKSPAMALFEALLRRDLGVDAVVQSTEHDHSKE